MTPEERARHVIVEHGFDSPEFHPADLERLLAAAIRAAVAEEREACEKHVDAVWNRYSAGDHREGAEAAMAVLLSIRHRPPP